MGGERREKEGERGRGEGREEGDGRTNPKPAATGLQSAGAIESTAVELKNNEAAHKLLLQSNA